MSNKLSSVYFFVSWMLYYLILEFNLDSLHSKPIIIDGRTYNIDYKNSFIKFKVETIVSSVVNGQINEFYLTSSKQVSNYKKSSLFIFNIKSKSIKIGNLYIDEAIQSEYYLDSKNHPNITVKILEMQPTNILKNFYYITYSIQIKNIEKQYREIFYYQRKGNQIIIKGIANIPKDDFFKWNLILDFVFKENIQIDFLIILKKV
ncbi:MAG: YceI family protein [Leptospiraceae bacterium]|nr:YceI family protein [Leptospiraceae bacterium]MDW7975580.1 YceI family protein [Leptospiraceae bacterium]